MSKSLGNLRESVPKTSETLQTRYCGTFIKKRFIKILENLWQSSETFGYLRKQFKSVFQCFYDFLKCSENLWKSSEEFRKSSEIFRKLRKRFQSNFQMFLWFFKIFGKSLEIFGSVRKSLENFWTWSEMFVMVRRSWKVSELASERSSNGPQ